MSHWAYCWPWELFTFLLAAKSEPDDLARHLLPPFPRRVLFIPPGINVHNEHRRFLAVAQYAHIAMVKTDYRHFLAVAPARW